MQELIINDFGSVLAPGLRQDPQAFGSLFDQLLALGFFECEINAKPYHFDIMTNPGIPADPNDFIDCLNCSEFSLDLL